MKKREGPDTSGPFLIGCAEVHGKHYFHGNLSPVQLSRLPVRGTFERPDRFGGQAAVGRLQDADIGQTPRRVDYERNHYAGWNRRASDDDPDIPDPFVHPFAECSDVVFPEQGRRVAVYQAERIAENGDLGLLLFCRSILLPEGRPRGCNQQERAADFCGCRHGLAWNTARSSPSLSSNSIGPSMS